MRELHLICAGSLLGVALTHKHISFPVGKVNRLKLYPMNFGEFVIANGRKDLVDIFMDWPDNRPVPEIYSIPMNKLLKEFYVVGGMPEVVKTWIETHDYGEVDRLQRDILRDYADDFSKYAPDGEVPKLRWIWDSVPVQIAKENNKFIFSHVKAGKRSADLEDALQWLTDAWLLIKCTLVEKPQIPLSGFADETYFKVYMSDIGLLRARSGLSPEAIIDEHGSYDRFKGAFAENYVLTELLSLGKEAHFWRSGNSAEVDFLFESNSSFIPVEVKSADNTQAKSYKQFCKLYKPSKGFKLSKKDVAKNLLEETVTYSMPLYMTWNINRYL